jgi:cell wall-associated NlpC family hydrolase
MSNRVGMRRCATILAAAAALGAVAPTPTLAAPAVLVQGSHGQAVRAVQRKLGLLPDGIYGRQTVRAVRAFQRRSGLPVTGQVDRRTRAALFAPAPVVEAPAAEAPTTGGAAADTPDSMAPEPTPVPGQNPAEVMVAAARSAIGKPYQPAGAGPDGFDCSGLIVWAAGQAGITGMPRSSFDQYKTGTAVVQTAVVAGDLVFFDTGGPGASDVGIASSPDTVISATTHGVREHPLSGPYWGDHYVGARRL